MAGLVLSRHELRWVLEQCGADRWPYPLRPVTWESTTEDATARHRVAVEAALRGRGLLDPAPARVLLAAGEVVAGWRVALDLVRRDAAAPCAAVALTDGVRAVVLASAEHADTPVHVVPTRPDLLPETVLALVPPAPAGMPARPPDADDVLAGADAITDVGAATREAGGAPVRASSLVTWVDGPRGRFAVRRPSPGITRPAVLIGVNDRHLAADIHIVLGEAGHSAAMPTPPTPGRSTA